MIVDRAWARLKKTKTIDQKHKSTKSMVYQGINTIDQDPISKDSRPHKKDLRTRQPLVCAPKEHQAAEGDNLKNTIGLIPRKRRNKWWSPSQEKKQSYTLQKSPEKKDEMGWTLGCEAWRRAFKRAAKSKYGLIAEASWHPPRQSQTWSFRLSFQLVIVCPSWAGPSAIALLVVPASVRRHDAVGEASPFTDRNLWLP